MNGLTKEEVVRYWMDAADELREMNGRMIRVVLLAHAATLNPENRDAWNDLCLACEDISDAELDILASKDDA
jgi:hypothetical protein